MDFLIYNTGKMKSLSLYINERKNQLPFTYQQFVDWIDYIFDYDDRQEELNRLLDERKPGLSKMLRDWVLANRISGGSNMKLLYNTLEQSDLRRIDRLLGVGGYGLVLDQGDRVLKWFHEGQLDSDEQKKSMKFYKWQLHHHHPSFIYIYKLTNRYVVAEKVKTGTEACRRMDRYTNDPKSIDQRWPLWKQVLDNDRPDGIPDDVWEWNQSVKEAMKEMGVHYPGDLSLDNLGETRDGRVVYMDI